MTDRKSRKFPALFVISTIFLALLFCTLTYKDGCLPPAVPLEAHRSSRQIHRLELNGADRESLLAVPGMTEKAAAAILADRDRRGGFRHIRQLWEIEGLDGETMVEILPYLTVSRRTP